MSAGEWHAPWHGNFEMTTDDLAEMVDHFHQGVAMVEGSKKLPVNYGHDITGKAAGWITNLSVENGGTELWGDVEWTPEGQRMLADGEFRYISPEWNPRSFPYQDPEDEDNWLNNVFTGAGLTNIPLFKKLKPIMAAIVQPKVNQASVVFDDSDKSKGEPMDLAAVRAKKPEELTDDEKKFIAEHAAELTAEERKTFDVQTHDDKAAEAKAAADDKAKADEGAAAAKEAEDAKAAEEAKNVEASAKGGVVSISKTELEGLKASAARADALALEIATDKTRIFVAAAVKDGRIKTGDSERWVKTLLASAGAQRSELEQLINGLPKNERLGKELGDGGIEASAEKELSEHANKLVADSNGKLSYSAAIKQAVHADADLRDRVNAERNQTNGK